MSGHHHDEHQQSGPKPVAFTVPFILACVTLVFVIFFLSLCNPKHGHCECKDKCSKECMEACEKGDHSKHDKKCCDEGETGHQEHGEKATKAPEAPSGPDSIAVAAPQDAHAH